MSRREALLSVLVVFGVAVAARIIAGSSIVFPKPEDTAYYVGVARNLVEGRGLITDALWSFQTEPLMLPREAFEVWLPLPSLIAAIPIWLVRGQGEVPLDVAFRAAQVTSILFGALVAVLAWRLAADVAEERELPPGRARTLALGTGLTAAVYLPLLLHSALPDSTMPFAAIALGAALVMTRILRDPRSARLTDPRLISLGLLLGLAALTRNEAAWIAVIWVLLVLGVKAGWPERVRMIGVVGVVSLLVFAPWAYRDWVVFGSPFPGQAITNAFSIDGHDIFAWNEEPTLQRYLAVGPARLLEMRVEGAWHNLWNVLVSVGMPIALVGFLALPWQARDRALRPVVLIALATFVITSLLFPVSTTWGTFLHAAGPAHVLLIISALGALDSLIVRVGRWRGWHRPVAWLGPALAIFGSVLFSVATLPVFAGGSRFTMEQYAELDQRLTAAGVPDAAAPPIIHDFPIWLAETGRRQSIALPEESPADVLDLARAFGSQWLLITARDESWPGVLDTDVPGADCFEEVPLAPRAAGRSDDPLEGARLYRITCVDAPTVHVP